MGVLSARLNQDACDPTPMVQESCCIILGAPCQYAVLMFCNHMLGKDMQEKVHPDDMLV